MTDRYPYGSGLSIASNASIADQGLTVAGWR